MSRRERLTWDEYFVKMLDSVAERATCDRGRCAALIVADRQVLATGYVGAPPGFPHCDDVGHLMEAGHCVRTVHAEQNALASAARRGIPVMGATLYTSVAPCRSCAMLAVTAGIRCVVAATAYQNSEGLSVLSQARIPWTLLDGEMIYGP